MGEERQGDLALLCSAPGEFFGGGKEGEKRRERADANPVVHPRRATFSDAVELGGAETGTGDGRA